MVLYTSCNLGTWVWCLKQSVQSDSSKIITCPCFYHIFNSRNSLSWDSSKPFSHCSFTLFLLEANLCPRLSNFSLVPSLIFAKNRLGTRLVQLSYLNFVTVLFSYYMKVFLPLPHLPLLSSTRSSDISSVSALSCDVFTTDHGCGLGRQVVRQHLILDSSAKKSNVKSDWVNSRQVGGFI